jgi:hypothetical protein
VKRLVSTLTSAALTFVAISAHAFCPCYTLSSSSNDHMCGVEAAPGVNPSSAEWADIFDLVAQGPAVWGDKGPAVGDIGQGCGKPEASHPVPARFPCEILKAIAMVETGWRQFCVPDTPSDQVGGESRTIISFDCGYGIGQVTSGMHVGETPSFDRARVAADPTYNMATGTQILASKWKATNCVGDNQPSIVEHWYTATWAYNGLAWKNNPNNPDLDPNREVYDPAVGGSYAYQEKVFGRIEHPTSGSWPSIPLAYPDRAECGDTGSPPDLSEPRCASPTDCGNTRETHVSTCFPAGSGGASGGAGAGGAGGDPGVGAGGGGTSGNGGAAGLGGSIAGAGGSMGGSPGGGAGEGGQGNAGEPGASGHAGKSGGSGGASASGASGGGGAMGTAGPAEGAAPIVVELKNGDESGACTCEAPGRSSSRAASPSVLGLVAAIVVARGRRRRAGSRTR